MLVFIMTTPDATEKFLAALPPEQLEFLAELADELEPEPDATDPVLLSGLRHSPGLQLLTAAKKVDRARQESSTPHGEEWNEELGNELAAAEKRSGRRLPAVLTVPEALDYIEAAKENERDHVLVRLFYSTGMRIGEVDELKVADIYFDDCRIFVRDGKSDRDRYVLVDPDTCELLAKWCLSLKEDDYVFKLEDSQIRRRVKEVAKKTGIYKRHRAMGRNFVPHSLRHSFATHLYEGGMDIFALQTLLGHKYVHTTRGYVRIGVGILAERYRVAHPLCRDQ